MKQETREEVFKISKKHLPNELSQHPKRVAYYSDVLEELNVKRRKAEALYEQIRGSIYMKWREKLIEENPKLMSEKYLDAKVNANKKVKEAFNNYIEMERKYKAMQGFVKALHTKTDMLKEFAYTVRGEMKQGVLRKAQRLKRKYNDKE